ncbi:DUF1707 SHOCT-like domain-containing protein [Streptomyces stelliscabiei]|uniref:DUF1707 SHOCT-like domain-containing protein n=1 Tax=Streptomyces stelliscabiei TaxID=146820 RepID=UPI0029BC5C74|nr:DUF1707 domain-containing protein [Streptomyces stelliscabiei]MDX2556836.1 DUF1707 domain-containing protein [Streptomyces stelliscabiei]MDX2615777.1 DUF1707 domain-containing protein [Streptomyces stelliscabiei]MDX2640581.1 DUF1707 domain-containing protein [Streptomyces stelliscabiei]MDX2667237.1 DUF1707 domain-containing protein [Streptomyces stelliscabiei]MDX2716478.1 DUF1707 domain-containing protein [Streptomyces stelliscabiei]
MTDDLPDVPAAADLRASDADRERVSEQLRDALAEGRLDMEEFEERLDATYKARTYGELAPITRDLPGAGAVAPPELVPQPSVSLVKGPAVDVSWPERIVGGDGTSTWGVAVLSGFERKGRWTVPERFDCFAFWGGGELDLRDAYFASREVTINCVAIMGGINVVVPPGVEVVVRGVGIMGGFDHGQEGVPGEPGAPRVIITGFAFWGGVGVERKMPKAERQRLKEARRQERLERRQARRELHASHRDHTHERHEAHREAMDQIRDAVRSRREEERERRRRRER